MPCKHYRCKRARAHGRYCRQHHEAFHRAPAPLVVEPLDRSQRIQPTYGGYLRGCIAQYKRDLK
jgi:hypothetical protein